MDLSRLSTADLEALQANDLSRVSTAGLRILQELQAEPAPKARFSGADTMRAVGQGALGGIKALTDVFGAGNAASNILEAGSTRLQEGMTPGRKAEMERQAQRMREAEASGDVKREAMAGLENFLEAPVQATAQGLGSIVPFAATSVAGAAAKLLPATIRAIQTAMGAGMGAGAAKGSIYDAVYKQNIDDGKAPAVAHQQAQAAQEYVGKNAEQIALGTGLGAVAARTGAEKLLVPGAEKGLAAGMARRVGKAVAEEVPLEAAQGGQERMAANIALQREGVNVPTFQGVAGQAVQEGLTAGMGAAPIAAYRSPRAGMEAAARAEEAKRVETVAAEQQAAIEARRADPNYLTDLLSQSADYQSKIKALDDTVKAAKPAKGETADPVAIAAARAARTTKDELLRSPEYEAHQAELQEAAPALQELKATQAKTQAEQTAAAAAEREAKLADPVLQEQLQGQYRAVEGQRADLRNQIDAANRAGDHTTALTLTDQFAELDAKMKELQPQLGPRPTTATTATPEALQAELTRLIGGTTKSGAPKAGEIMKLFDAGDTAGAKALMAKADELRAQIAEPTRARDAVQRQIEAFKAQQAPATVAAATPAPTAAAATPPANLTPEAAKQWLLDRTEGFRDAQRTPLNPNFTEQRTLPLTANPVQYTSAATVARREQTLEDLKNEFGALVRSARTQRVQGRVDPVLKEQITAKADEIRDFGSAVARQDVPRGQATAEVAPALAGTQRPETLPRGQNVENVERKYTPEKATEEAVTQALGALPTDLAPEDDALVQQVTAALPALKNAGEAADTMNVPSIEGVPYDRVTAELAPTRALDDVAAYLYKLRTGNDASTEAGRVQEHLARLERGKRSETQTPTRETAWGTATKPTETAVQEDMFPDTEMQGTIFNSYAAFEDYLAGDAVKEVRMSLGRTLATAARLQRELAPMEADIAKLRERLSSMQDVLAFTIGAGDASVAAAQAKQQAAVDALRSTVVALEAKLDPQRAALQQAMLDLYNAQAAQAKIGDAIAKNTAQFNRDPGIQAAAAKVAAAQEAHAAALKRAAATGKADFAETTRLYNASVAAINEQRAMLETYAKDSQKLQERSILAFLNRDMALVLRLHDAEQTVEKARADVETTQAVLNTANAALQAQPETQQAMREAKQRVSTAQGVLTKARTRAMTARTRDAGIVAETSDKLQELQRGIAEKKAPVQAAQEARVAPPMEERQTQREDADAARRKAEQERTERLAAIPGAQVTHTNMRTILDDVERMPDRIRALDAAAKDETASKAARNKAKYAAADLRERSKIMYGLISSDPAFAQAAVVELDKRVADVEEKIGAKQIAVNEPGKAKSTITSRRKELAELKTDLRQLNRLSKLAKNRASFAPVGTSKQTSTALADRAEQLESLIQTEENAPKLAAYKAELKAVNRELDKRDEAEQRLTLERGINLETEGTTGKLPERTIGPLLKKAVQAGNILTGDTSTTGERTVAVKNKPQQGGKKRGITGAQAMAQSGKDVAHEQALLKLTELEDLQERNDAALAKARADKDAAAIAKYEGFAERLATGIAATQKRVDATVSTAADIAVLDNTVAPETDASAASQFRSARQTTEVDEDVIRAVQDGRVLDAAKLLAARGSTPDVRERAAKLIPMLMRTKISVEPEVIVDGKSVAGKFDPRANAITMAPGGINEEDLLHEMTHAATDRTLLAPDNTLTDDQRAAKRELEALRVMITASPKFANEDIGNTREFAAEVFSNEALRAKMDNLGKPLSLGKRFINLIGRLVGWGPVYTPDKPLSKKAEALVERIMQPSRKIDTTAAAAPSAWRGQAVHDFGDLAGTPIADLRKTKPDTRTIKERFLDDAAMRAEYNLADMHNYIVAAMRQSNSKIGQQAEFDIRAAGSASMLSEAFIKQGAPEHFTDSKGFSAIRASDKNAGAEFFKAVSALPGADAQVKFELMTNYMMALRGLRVGPEKVGPTVTRAQLQAVVDQVRNDPSMYAPMEAARAKYNAYNDRLVQMAVKAGAISAAEGKRMTENGDYVPMYREHDGKLQAVVDGRYETIGDIAHTPYMHALKGGEERVLPINETIFLNTELLTKMALINTAKNNIGHTLAQVGKPHGKMQIGEGTGPASTQNLTWKEDGKDYHLILDTEGTPLSGIPTAMLAQSIDGYHATLPQTLMWMQKANDYLRAGVTRMPMYTLRQLIKDPASAAIIRGMDGGPLTAVARAFKEYGKIMVGKTADIDRLSRMGLVQNAQFTGTSTDDMHALARQMAGGNAPSAIRTLLNFLDKSAGAANATTQLQLYNDGLKKGMSEVEALHHARESMNFHKRGASATIQQMNRTMIFFNSGIQALNVLQNTLRGKMPFEERLKTQQKFMHNAVMVFAAGFLYAAGMGDDEEYKKLKIQDKLGNLHIFIGDTPIKLPISYFETGGMMWAAGQALAAMASGDAEGDAIIKAMGRYALTAVPGGGGLPIGPGVKQVGEWVTNKDFTTFRDIVPASKAGLTPEAQVSASTPEGMRMVANALGVSADKLRHAFDSLFGVATTSALQVLDQIMQLGDTEKTARGLSETPFISSLFQNKTSSEALDEMYSAANDATAVKKTLDRMKSEGQGGEKIRRYVEENKDALVTDALTSKFTQAMAALTKAISVTEASDKTSEEKKTLIDKFKQQKNDIAETMNKARKELVNRLA